MQLLCCLRFHWKYISANKSRIEKKCVSSATITAPILYQRTNIHVPWFWICREVNFGLRGPSGDEPFTQKLMSVKRGSGIPLKLQPILTPLETRYFGHSCACSSSMCLWRNQTASDGDVGLYNIHCMFSLV